MNFAAAQNSTAYCLSNVMGNARLVGDWIVGSFSVGVPLLIKAPSALQQKKTVFIRDLGDDRVCLREAFPVAIECYGSQVIAYSADTGDYSVASEEFDAVEEFKASLVELYFMLKSEKDHLGKLPLRHWNFLKALISER